MAVHVAWIVIAYSFLIRGSWSASDGFPDGSNGDRRHKSNRRQLTDTVLCEPLPGWVGFGDQHPECCAAASTYVSSEAHEKGYGSFFPECLATGIEEACTDGSNPTEAARGKSLEIMCCRSYNGGICDDSIMDGTSTPGYDLNGLLMESSPCADVTCPDDGISFVRCTPVVGLVDFGMQHPECCTSASVGLAAVAAQEGFGAMLTECFAEPLGETCDETKKPNDAAVAKSTMILCCNSYQSVMCSDSLASGGVANQATGSLNSMILSQMNVDTQCSPVQCQAAPPATPMPVAETPEPMMATPEPEIETPKPATETGTSEPAPSPAKTSRKRKSSESSTPAPPAATTSRKRKSTGTETGTKKRRAKSTTTTAKKRKDATTARKRKDTATSKSRKRGKKR